MNEMNEMIESYVNGNISYVRECLHNSASISLSEFLEIYIQEMNPSTDEIVRFINRME